MKSILVALLLIPFFPALAAEKDPRPEMHALVQEIVALQKFLLSESQFLDAKNDAAIRQSLGVMNQHIDGLKKEGTFANDPALKVNLGLLAGHMQDAEKFFKEGNKPFSRFMLQSSMQMCIACHTRGKVNVDFAVPEENLKAASALERGDFLFATRQFEKGRLAYEEVVSGFPGNKVGPFGLRKALLALAVYYARVKEDPKAARDYFSSVARRELPVYLQKEAKAWAADFGEWAKEKPRAKPQTETELVGAAKRLLRYDDFTLVGSTDRRFHVRRLRASALLHRALESPGEKSPAKAEALLYLGQIYHRIQHQLFFRFGEMYLKACVQDYAHTKAARDCYHAYEEAVTEGFTGSAGTNIPEDEEVELLRLKRLAQ